jgi:hypothetical protein
MGHMWLVRRVVDFGNVATATTCAPTPAELIATPTIRDGRIDIERARR